MPDDCLRPSSSKGPFGTKSDRRDNGKQDEETQGNELRDLKGRLGLRRSDRVQRWYF